MRDFDATSVKRVIDWMYSGNIDIPASSLSQDLAVAAYLRVKDENAFRPYLTVLHVLDETMNRLVLDLAEAIPRLKASEIAQLTQNSIIATMAAMLSMEQKVPLINMAILWILTKKPGRGAVNAIIQSLVVGDITFDTLYSLRYSLKQYLTNPDLAGKTELSISPSGTIGLKIDIKRHGAPTRQSRDNSVKSSSSRSNCSVSSSDKRYGCNTKKCQMYRTRSELSSIAHMPDPFGPDRLAPSPNFVRETTAGVPVYFTRSEVEDLHKMKDPFQQADNESAPPAPCTKKIYGFSGDKYTVKYPGWNPNSAAANIAAEKAKRASMAARYTPSDIQVVRNMPDPFVSYSDCVGPSTAAEKAKRASMAARYTPSDIQVVQNMPDPFVGFNQNSAAANVAKEREKQAAMAARYTPSDIQVVRNMPDPFV
uniref:BTB domain-containing protein n=1 Tax=Caenorhabditis japonica TaxID=281687 RepID=A0A8R1DY74_CAEJA